MSQQQHQQLLIQILTVPQILRTYGKQFRQIQEQYSDGHDGRCAMSAVLSYFGWDAGELNSDITTSLQAAFSILSNDGLRDVFYIIELNDSGMTFKEIANYLDRIK